MQIPMQMSTSESLLLGLLGWGMKQGAPLNFKTSPTGDLTVTLGQTMTVTLGGPKPWV